MGEEVKPFWKEMVKLAIDSQTPTVVSGLFEWMRGLEVEQIHRFAGKLTSRDAETFRAVVAAVKGTGLPA